MPRTCEFCCEPIAFLDARTSSGNSAWHTRCWNQAAAERASFQAERDDCEGFPFRSLPDELGKSETGAGRSEVIPHMATQPNRAPREVVDFPANTPVTVALKYAQGKTVSSQSGERFMFSLTDGRVMFLAPEIAGQIVNLGVNVRENFTITRKWDGQKDSLNSWEVARIPGEQPNGTLVVPSLEATGTPAADGAIRKPAPRAHSLLVEETNSLVDAYAQVLDRTLNTYPSWAMGTTWRTR